MPRRSDREEFGNGAFEDNPFEGDSPEKIYTKIQWGNEPQEITECEAPEPLVNLGYIIELHHEIIEVFEEGEYLLAIGAKSNLLYMIPTEVEIEEIPTFDPSEGGWKPGPKIRQENYVSEKGGEECEYFHEHEKPFPQIWKHTYTGICLIIPANLDGKRSYAVVKEGIIG